MKKTETEIRDIYHEEAPVERRGGTADSESRISDLIEREMRRRLIFNLLTGALTLILIYILLSAFIKDYLSLTDMDPPVKKKASAVAAYTLPPEEQWVIDYRQVANEADSTAPPGPKSVSTKWIKNAAYHIIMGEQALRMEKLVAAQKHLEVAAETFPAMTGIREPLGTAYLKQQDYVHAAKQLEAALAEKPSVAALNNLGVAWLGIGEYARAEKNFRQALQQEPESAACYKNLALLYQETASTNEAVTAFEKYFFLNPHDTPLLEHYISYLTAAGRNPDAIRFLERVDGADPLTVNLLIAKTAAQDADAERALRALREVSRFLTPRQTIAEMHGKAFEKIARTEPFEALLYQLELSAVSLSTDFSPPKETP